MAALVFDSIVRELRHASLAAALFVAIAPNIGAQGSGDITGVVTTAAAGPRPLRATIDQKVCGTDVADESIVVDGSGRLANAVITIKGVRAPAAGASGVLNETCRFSPRVQIVRPNAMITTSSADPILHTTDAQAEGGKTPFNVAVPIPGLKINTPIAGPGLVRLTCNTHPWMRGFIVVTDDVAAISGADGSFALKNVPAGTYELTVWHETLKGARQRVTVTAGQTTTANVMMQ